MQITNIQNQTNFNGRAYLLTDKGNKLCQNAVKQINSMKIMRNADFNIYMGTSCFYPNKFCLIAAKDSENLGRVGKLTSRNVPSIIETAKILIAERNAAMQAAKEEKPQSIFQKICDLFK